MPPIEFRGTQMVTGSLDEREVREVATPEEAPRLAKEAARPSRRRRRPLHAREEMSYSDSPPPRPPHHAPHGEVWVPSVCDAWRQA